MPVTCLLLDMMSSLQLSNSFNMWGCTASGSEEPRMASKSSSERKQNRENTNLLESRYSERLFWRRSSSSDRFLSSDSLLSQRTQQAQMLGVLQVCSMTFLKAALFFSNFLLSSLSCCLMSSLPMKMPSRYIHFFCTCIQTSMHSEMRLRERSQLRMRDEKAPAYLLEATVCRLDSWSSSSSFFSSTLVSTQPLSSLPFLYLARSKFSFFHTWSILLSSSSFLNSWMASLTISPTSSSYFSSFISNTWLSVIVLIDTSNFLPVSPISFSQCRSVMDPFFSRIMRGIEFLKDSTLSFSFLYTGCSLSYFCANFRRMFVYSFSMFFCSWSASSFSHRVDEQSLMIPLSSLYTSYSGCRFLFSSSMFTNSGKLEMLRLNSFSASTSSSLRLLSSSVLSLQYSISRSPSSRSVWGELGPSALYCWYSTTSPFLNSATSSSVSLANSSLLLLRSASLPLALTTRSSHSFSRPNASATFSASTGWLYIWRVLNFSTTSAILNSIIMLTVLTSAIWLSRALSSSMVWGLSSIFSLQSLMVFWMPSNPLMAITLSTSPQRSTQLWAWFLKVLMTVAKDMEKKRQNFYLDMLSQLSRSSLQLAILNSRYLREVGEFLSLSFSTASLCLGSHMGFSLLASLVSGSGPNMFSYLCAREVALRHSRFCRNLILMMMLLLLMSLQKSNFCTTSSLGPLPGLQNSQDPSIHRQKYLAMEMMVLGMQERVWDRSVRMGVVVRWGCSYWALIWKRVQNLSVPGMGWSMSTLKEMSARRIILKMALQMRRSQQQQQSFMTGEHLVLVPRTNSSMFLRNWSPMILYFSASSATVLCMCSSEQVENSDELYTLSFRASKSNSFRITASSMLFTMSSIMPELLATFFLMSRKPLIALRQLSMKSLMPRLDRFLLSWPCSITLFSWQICDSSSFFSMGLRVCTASSYSRSIVFSLSMQRQYSFSCRAMLTIAFDMLWFIFSSCLASWISTLKSSLKLTAQVFSPVLMRIFSFRNCMARSMILADHCVYFCCWYLSISFTNSRYLPFTSSQTSFSNLSSFLWNFTIGLFMRWIRLFAQLMMPAIGGLPLLITRFSLPSSQAALPLRNSARYIYSSLRQLFSTSVYFFWSRLAISSRVSIFLKLLSKSKAPSLERKSEKVLSMSFMVLCSRVACWVLKLLKSWLHKELLVFSKKFSFASTKGTTKSFTSTVSLSIPSELPVTDFRFGPRNTKNFFMLSVMCSRSLRQLTMCLQRSARGLGWNSHLSSCSSSMETLVFSNSMSQDSRMRLPWMMRSRASMSLASGFSDRLKMQGMSMEFWTLSAISLVMREMSSCILSMFLQLREMIQIILRPFMRLGIVSWITLMPSSEARFLNCLSRVVRNLTFSLASAVFLLRLFMFFVKSSSTMLPIPLSVCVNASMRSLMIPTEA